MNNIQDTRIVPREEVSALFRERFGTDNIGWSIQPGDDSAIGQGVWLNYFNANPEDDSVVVGRGDERFFQVRVRMRKEGYIQPVLFEEPKVPHPAPGRPRVVGFIRVYVNLRGYVKTKSEATLIGETLMIHASSVSRDEQIVEGAQLLGNVYVYTNPQRIEGAVEVEIFQLDFPDDDEAVRRVREIAVLTADGRTLSVAAKLLATTNA